MFYKLFLAGSLLLLPLAAQAAEPGKTLDVYFVDTEGGAATLIVTPSGESVLIDCGNPGTRDAERIHRVASAAAGLKGIDHLAITHWHLDHYGGVGRLAQLMPIGRHYNRGIPDTLSEDKKNFPILIQDYKQASKGKHMVLKPGDEIPLKSPAGGPALKLLCVCSAGEVLPDKPGAVENAAAKDHKPQPVDTSDNARSLGFVLSYGGFRFLDLGDLTWNIEYKLVHPTDKLGKVDVYQSTHHGLEVSNNPVVIQTVQPRVAIFNNGARKGCHPQVIAALRRVPGLEAIYQLHRNVQVGAQENTDPEYIANPDEKCQGEYIKLSVAADGKSYTVKAGSKGKAKQYKTRE